MAKPKTNYVCQECGAVQQKWAGQCPDCHAWNSISQEAAPRGFTKMSGNAGGGKILEFANLTGKAEAASRIATGIGELDRVLGGGLVEGSAILIGGDPGIGKSTLLLQMCAALATADRSTMIVTGEESVEQVRLRARRLGVAEAPVKLATATNVSDILASIREHRPTLAVIDSIQTMFVDSIESAPGTVSQVRQSAHELISACKQIGTSLVLVGHVTKDGQIAGPRVLEHMVDTVLYFEGDRGHQFRIVRAVKNRFGAANEIGVFAMSDKGLEEVANPSALFISGKAGEVSGSVIFAGIEGTRPVLTEIQALVAPSSMAQPRRAVVGWDSNRLAMVLAVLQARGGFNFSDKEVYLNVAGGLRITEPAADLAAAAALVSALANLPIAPGTAIFGEIGLSGEVRPVAQAEQRLKEARKLGFKGAILPTENLPKDATKPFIISGVSYISQLKNFLAGGQRA